MLSVQVGSLGKCEHCGTVFTLEILPSDAMDAEWKCAQCGNTLGPASYGMEQVTGTDNWKKTKWVGQKGEWVKKQPDTFFKLGNFDVHPPFRSFL